MALNGNQAIKADRLWRSRKGMPNYDRAASSFARHRALPHGLPEAIRSAVLAEVTPKSQPWLLDLGAGSGRIGLPFVAARDDYVAVDLSSAMLREFAHQAALRTRDVAPALVQADGRCLPFADAAFDAVLMVQVVSALDDWSRLVEEAWRVLRSTTGVLVVGHRRKPETGLDERMKASLASILQGLHVPVGRTAPSQRKRWLSLLEHAGRSVIVAEWQECRTPRQFLERHQTGARFSELPQSIRTEALRRLEAWAVDNFTSLDAISTELHGFELKCFRKGAGP